MASSVALEQHRVPQQETASHPQQKVEAEIVSLVKCRREQLLKKSVGDLTGAELRLLAQPERQHVIELDGEEFSVVANGQCDIETIDEIDLSKVDRFKLKKLVDTHVKYPEETHREMHHHSNANMADKCEYLTRVFIATLLYQDPPPRHWTHKSKVKPQKYYGISLQGLQEKLGLTGNELLLFPSNGIVNVLGGADFDENGMIHLDDGNVSYEKDGCFFPFGRVKKVLIANR